MAKVVSEWHKYGGEALASVRQGKSTEFVQAVIRRLRPQCRGVDSLAAGRDGGNARGDTKIDATEPTELLHRGIDLLGVRSLWSRMDSGLSRTMSISFEDRSGRRGVMSSGVSTPAPMVVERRRRE